MVGGDSMECYCHLRNIQDLLSDGKTSTRGGSEYHLLARLLRLEIGLNIAQFLQKTCREYINLVLKSCQVYSSFVSCMRGESGKETFWSQTLKNWSRWTRLNSMFEGWMQRKC